MKQKRYPEGHFIEWGVALGLILGVPIGLALGNLAWGPAIGVILGISIGFSLEKQKNPNPRQLTKEEENVMKGNMTAILYSGTVIFLIVLMSYLVFH
ncbi:MAG: hypothetical protein KAJ91_03345 [Candidatus Aenigmarchaeota archaeon]|nr:hypothetical protein [Candidatus Aenigmarchaeota archaeon]